MNTQSPLDAFGSEGYTALMLISKLNRPKEYAQLLLDAGADVTIINERGETALSLAEQYAPDLVPVYQAALAPILAEAALCEAVANGDTAKVTELLQTANDDAKNKALFVAVVISSHPMVNLLMSHGADPFVGYPVDECDRLEARYGQVCADLSDACNETSSELIHSQL